MKTITLKKETIEKYLNSDDLSEKDTVFCKLIATSKDEEITLDMEMISKELLEYILTNDASMDLQTKAEIALTQLKPDTSKNPTEPENIWDTPIKYLDDIMKVYESLKKEKFNVDFLIFGRKNPARLLIELENATRYQSKHVLFSLYFEIHKSEYKYRFKIQNESIVSLRKYNKNMTFRDLVVQFDLFEQKEDVSQYLNRLSAAKEIQKRNGKQMTCSGFAVNEDFSKSNMRAFNHQSKAIVESELELKEERYAMGNHKNAVELPYVRVFSLLHKKYVFIHVDDLAEYQYDERAFEKLFLPEKMKDVLGKVFSYSSDQLTGDIINNKHGGLIVLAAGNPGTGKTSTAEVYSEFMRKPFYTIQVDEIGTSPKEIEANLSKIFARIEKWEAVILFDEVDVFLSKRDNDIHKSAIVGIFLRLMDYFRGMMFLTTNRSEVIDEAVLSRVTLTIKYPDFDESVRRLVWHSKLKDAGMQIDATDQLIQEKLNGRQIRNMVRLAKIVLGTEIKEEELIGLVRESLGGDK